MAKDNTPPGRRVFPLVAMAFYLRTKGKDLAAWQCLNEALRYGHSDAALTERARLLADLGLDELAENDWERVRRRTPELPPWRTVLTLWRYLDRDRENED